MPSARTVRIARSSPAPDRAEPPEHRGPGRSNRSGRQRGVRSFLLFLAPLTGIYVGLLELLLSSPTAGLRGDALLDEVFSGIFVLAALLGFLVTVPSAPRWVRVEEDRMWVQGFLGSPRLYPRDERLRVLVVERHSGGLLSAEATVQVLLVHPDQRTRRYLVEEGLIPADRSAAPRPA